MIRLSLGCAAVVAALAFAPGVGSWYTVDQGDLYATKWILEQKGLD